MRAMRSYPHRFTGRHVEITHTVLQEGMSKAGNTERALFRKMRSLESEARKQEQVCNSKKAALQTSCNATKKQAQNQLRDDNAIHNEVSLGGFLGNF